MWITNNSAFLVSVQFICTCFLMGWWIPIRKIPEYERAVVLGSTLEMVLFSIYCHKSLILHPTVVLYFFVSLIFLFYFHNSEHDNLGKCERPRLDICSPIPWKGILMKIKHFTFIKFYAYTAGVAPGMHFCHIQKKSFRIAKFYYKLAWEPSIAKVTESYFHRLPALERFYRETKFSILKSTHST